MKKFLFLFLAAISLVNVKSQGQSSVEYTHWTLAHIINDYKEVPVYDSFITGGPVIEQLDSLGGSLIFYLTPQGNRDCRQAFRVGWQFARSVKDLEEGKSVDVEVFSYPVIDSVRGVLECFRNATEAVGQNEEVRVRFTGGSSTGLDNWPDLSFYWEQSSPDLFKVNQVIEAASGGNLTTASGSLLVQDPDEDPSADDVAFGAFAIEISREGAFDYRVIYLYDGKESDLSPAGAHRLLLDKLVVEHSVTGNSAEPVMHISLMGLLEQAVGHDVRIGIHFFDNYRRPLPGIEGDAVYCDSLGYAVTSSAVRRVPSRQYYLNELAMTMPYYALNLPLSNAGHMIYLHAEIFLDNKSIGMSRMAQTTFFW
ncbi:MAG TPA: hypothetical protein PKH94_01085 [Bacteroidales bacterium]|nr:hypothetical protein [Bacteroidales bacterium]HNS45811.1 hypothetical protein [Bacteroidales bacterium]